MDMQNLEFKALCGTSFDQSAGRLSVDISSDILNSPGATLPIALFDHIM